MGQCLWKYAGFSPQKWIADSCTDTNLYLIHCICKRECDSAHSLWLNIMKINISCAGYIPYPYKSCGMPPDYRIRSWKHMGEDNGSRYLHIHLLNFHPVDPVYDCRSNIVILGNNFFAAFLIHQIFISVSSHQIQFVTVIRFAKTCTYGCSNIAETWFEAPWICSNSDLLIFSSRSWSFQRSIMQSTISSQASILS